MNAVKLFTYAIHNIEKISGDVSITSLQKGKVVEMSKLLFSIKVGTDLVDDLFPPSHSLTK